jgi:hypothetical protein
MLNPIREICRFNEQAGLLDNGYDDFLESSMLVEEALEGLPIPKCIEVRTVSTTTHKDVARDIVESFTRPTAAVSKITDIDRLDKAGDAVVIAIGSMAKLRLSSQQITKALNVIMKHNFKKLGMPRDEYGKLTKPDDFTGPEAELQLILDERT